MRHYLRLYRVIGKTFGVWFRPLGAFGLLQLRQAISAITLGLDHVFYPGHRKQPIDRPIFIIGNPRSGTTFLHRLLVGAGDMAALELWEMLFPAITARKLLGRIVPRLDKLSPARYHPSDVHDTSLRGIETDDVAWFFRTMDGPFAWAYFLAWPDTWGSGLSPRVRDRRCDTARRGPLLQVLRRMLAAEPDAQRRQPGVGQNQHAHDASRGGVAALPGLQACVRHPRPGRGHSVGDVVVGQRAREWLRRVESHEGSRPAPVAGKPVSGFLRHAALLPRRTYRRQDPRTQPVHRALRGSDQRPRVDDGADP